MVMVVVTKGRDGVVRGDQVDPTTHRPRNTTPADPVPERPVVASQAFRELRENLYTWKLEKVLPTVAQLGAVEEAERLLTLERLHPVYGGGRHAILDRLEEMIVELGKRGLRIDVAALEMKQLNVEPVKVEPVKVEKPGPAESKLPADERADAKPAKPAVKKLPETAPRQKYPCDVCGFLAATQLGLSSHRKAKHPGVPLPVVAQAVAEQPDGVPASADEARPEPVPEPETEQEGGEQPVVQEGIQEDDTAWPTLAELAQALDDDPLAT